MITIEDGKGKGYRAEVASDNKLQTSAVSIPKLASVSVDSGKAYMIATQGFISLTTATEHGLLYLKYTGDKTLCVFNIRTCGTGVQKWKMYKDSTTGTLISGGAAVDVTNMNQTSGNVLSLTALKGADSSTVTNGTVIENWINNGGHSTEELQGALVLGKNDTLVLSCETSTSIDVCIRVHVYEAE